MEISYIYIISDGENFKIGLSKNDPELRLKSLQTGHPEKLFLVEKFKVPASVVHKLEKEAHKRIQYKYPKRGEWFKKGHKKDIIIIVDSVCEKYLIDM
jgi:hypothetical protein